MQHAEAARHNLEDAGFSSDEISTIDNKTLSMGGGKLNEPGLWQRLFGRDIQPYEALVYGRAIETGGVVLTVRVSEDEVASATNILNAHESVDLRKRALQQGLISNAGIPEPSPPPPPPIAAMAAGRPLPAEQVIALAEEKFDVGKRMVRDGTTRIRRFITETPVESQVSLHEEHTKVIRRACADPSFIRDVDWTDKTIEMSETIEEPVVTKSVHIAEEVVILKEATDKIRTVRDKVRRQQVEVEKIPNETPVQKH